MPASVAVAAAAAQAAEVPQLCSESPVVAGTVYAWRQDQIDSLASCEFIEGDLVIDPFPGIQLLALGRLKEVRGALSIGEGRALIWAAGGEEYSFDIETTPESLTTLAGLESLESVGHLIFVKLGIRDLSPLSSLRSIGPRQPGPGRSGWLSLQECAALESLSGLRALESLYGVELSDLAQGLSSLVGLENTTALGALRLQGGFGLATLAGLNLATEMDELSLEVSGLADVSALDAIERVGQLSLSNLPHYDLLPSLRTVEHLYLGSGPADASQAFAALRSVGTVTIERQHGLIAAPRFDSLEDVEGGVSLEVLSNINLESLPVMPGVRVFGVLRVEDNEALTEVAFPAVEAATEIHVLRNPALADVRLDGLATATRAVRVVGNGELDSEALSELADVVTPNLKLAGNRGDARDLSPCPWVLDGVCDEGPDGSTCAPDTDSEDCSN